MTSEDKGVYNWHTRRILSKNEGGGFDDRLDSALKNINVDINYLAPEHSNLYIVVDLTSRNHDLSACAYGWCRSDHGCGCDNDDDYCNTDGCGCTHTERVR